MISIEQINGEIAALEEEKPTHVIMQKLAALYTVRDHLIINAQNTAYANILQALPSINSNSEFAKAIEGKDPAKVMGVINELMETIKVLYPNLYNGVFKQLP